MSALTIRIGDDVYEEGRPLMERFALSYSTLNRWKLAGAVGTIERSGRTLYLSADVEFLATHTPAETLAAGKHRKTPAQTEYGKRWYRRRQDSTIDAAKHRNEEWTNAEHDAAMSDDDLAIVAQKIGRTYAAVIVRRANEHRMMAEAGNA
jgi:hypothetical protein